MIDNLKDAKEQLTDYYANKKELKEAIESDNISDTVSELADGNVDLYTYNLLEWVKEGYNYVEDGISELGFPESDGKPDFIKAIMAGQYMANQKLLYEAVEELKEELGID